MKLWNYVYVSWTAERWRISERRIRILCQQRKIEGITRKRRSYLISNDAVKLIDGRALRHKDVSEQYISLFFRFDSLKGRLNQHRPLKLRRLTTFK